MLDAAISKNFKLWAEKMGAETLPNSGSWSMLLVFLVELGEWTKRSEWKIRTLDVEPRLRFQSQPLSLKSKNLSVPAIIAISTLSHKTWEKPNTPIKEITDLLLTLKKSNLTLSQTKILWKQNKALFISHSVKKKSRDPQATRT